LIFVGNLLFMSSNGKVVHIFQIIDAVLYSFDAGIVLCYAGIVLV
jgi:hypothetical protein